MPKFKVYYTEPVRKYTYVNADNVEHAKKLVRAGEFATAYYDNNVELVNQFIDYVEESDDDFE